MEKQGKEENKANTMVNHFKLFSQDPKTETVNIGCRDYDEPMGKKRFANLLRCLYEAWCAAMARAV